MENHRFAGNVQLDCLVEIELYPELIPVNPNLQKSNANTDWKTEQMLNIDLTVKRSFLNFANSCMVVALVRHWHYATSTIMFYVSIACWLFNLQNSRIIYLTETNNNVIICIYRFHIGGTYLLCFIVIYYLIILYVSSNILYYVKYKCVA